jgi:Zn-dependent metalloprotease
VKISVCFFLSLFCLPILLSVNSSVAQKIPENSIANPFASKLLRHRVADGSHQQLQALENEMRSIPRKIAEFKAQAVALSKNQSPNISFENTNGLSRPSNVPLRVVFDRNHPTPIFIQGPRLQNSSTMTLNKLSDEAAARAGMDFLIANARLLRIENPAQEFELIDIDREDAGLTHIRYQQKYQGLEVWGQDIRIHLNIDGSVESFNGRYIPTPKSAANSKTLVDEQTAVRIAQQQLGAGSAEITSRKTIYVDESGQARVAWLVQLRRGLGENWYHFIDAETGVTLKRYNHVIADGPVTGSGVDLLNQTRTLELYQIGSTFYMIDPSKPMFSAAQSTLPQNGRGVIYTFDARTTDTTYYFLTSSSANSWPDRASVSASANGALVYDYYYQVHGRNAIDNNGSTIYLAVHYKKNWDNACWNGRMMLFGDGDGLVYSNLAAALDVTAHEMTHGVVLYTANLVYENQSGALNESFADVFGEMCEFWARGNCDWLIGEDVMTPGISGDGIRDMADPGSSRVAMYGQQQPSQMSEYRSMPNTPEGDFGGVHTNNGIPNHAFYLFAASPVVGRDNAAKVYYRALTKYLTRSAQFIDCRIAVIKSAEDLFGGPNNAVAIIAAQAFDAVGITGGNATEPPVALPSVQGQPYLAVVGSQGGLLYRSSPDGQNIQQISTVPLLGRPTPTDNGSFIFYVDGTNNLHIVSSDGSNHTQLSSGGGYNAVAISPNGQYLAATSSYQVPRLYVLDLLDTTNAGWKSFQLYIPIYSQGATGGTVRFPDRIDWALNNQVVMYDAYSTIVNATGDTSGYWDINLLRITDGSISRLIPPPPHGVSIGNPVFASNTNNIVAFDYVNEMNQVTVRAVNLYTGAIGIVTNNFSSLGSPSFSGDDRRIFYHYVTPSSASVWVVDLLQDGITGMGDDKQILLQAEYPVAFTVGTRVTNVAPNPPKLASPSNGATGLPTNPLLVWNSAFGANYYTLQVSTSQSFSSLVAYQTGVVDTLYRVSGLSNNMVYYWRVSAANTVGSSAYSNIASFTTITAPPQAPTLGAPADSARNVQLNTTLTWSAVSGATSYHLRVSTVPTFTTITLDDSTLNTTSRSIGPLSLATSYYWRVRAKNEGGWGAFSSTRQFSTIRTTMVEQLGAEIPKEFALSQNYPNPFNPATTIHFALPKSGRATLKVFDILGKEVTILVSEELSAGYYSVRWQASVPSGIYFYRLQAGEFVETKRMVLLK